MSMASRWIYGIVAAGFVCWGIGVKAGPLPLDPNALGGIYQGSVSFPTKVIGPSSLSADVDFAVYAPGHFNLSFPGQDPSGGTQWVYAYEVYSTSVAAGPSPASFFSVGILPISGGPAAAGATNIEHLPLVAGQAPGNSAFSSTSATWDFTAVPISLGSNSDILLFTSPHAPTMQSASVQGGGLGISHSLPSPVPEPSTFVLLAVGCVSVLVMRRLSARA